MIPRHPRSQEKLTYETLRSSARVSFGFHTRCDFPSGVRQWHARNVAQEHVMKKLRIIAWIAAIALIPHLRADEADDTNKVRVGNPAPDFTCTTLSGEEFSLSKQKGKVVLINFFATWCGPCRQELPHLQKEIAEKYKDRGDFKLIVIAREQTAEELKKFNQQNDVSVPMAPDPKREIYAKYADKYIPRNYIIGKDGTVKLASMGFSKESFQTILDTLQAELQKP